MKRAIQYARLYKKICPIWSKIIQLNKRITYVERCELSNKNNVSMVDGKLCIVGEAHGLSRKYASLDSGSYCGTCLNFSHNSLFELGDDYGDGIDRDHLKEFIAHFAKVHMKK